MKYIEVNLLLDLTKSSILVNELTHLEEKLSISKNPLNSLFNMFSIRNEITSIKSMDEMREYLMKGDGLDKTNVNKYIGDTLFESTNQIN